MRHFVGRETRGVTLVELLLVVMVLAIAAVVAAPMVGDTGATRLAAAGRLLLADIQFAQIDSIAHPDAVRGLRFDSGSGTYEVVTSDAPTLSCGSATVVTNPADNRSYTTQYGGSRATELSGVSIDSYALDGDACVGFGGYGQTDQASAATVTLRVGTETLTISIDPVSGEATAS